MKKKLPPIRVGIDGNEANCLNRVGSNAYAYYLICAMVMATKRFSRRFSFTIFLDKPPLPDMPKSNEYLKYQIVKPRKLWTQFALPLYLFIHANEFDIFFTPGHYAPRFCPIPYVSSVMDLAFLAYPQLFRRRDLFKLSSWTRYSVNNAQKIVTISKFSKKEIGKYYQRDSDDIIVATPGLGSTLPTITSQRAKEHLQLLGINKPYFLYLGTLQPRKNLVRLINAFEQLLDKYPKWRKQCLLVLAGKNGWLTDEITNAINNSDYQKQIILTGFVSEEQKAALLSLALASCNLGIYEGFGIPVLESLYYRCLPIYANNSSMTEVAGGLGFATNPFSLNAIERSLKRCLLISQEQKDFYRSRMDAQLKKFSYQKAANHVLSHLYKLAQPTRSSVSE